MKTGVRGIKKTEKRATLPIDRVLRSGLFRGELGELDAACGSDEECKIFKESPPGGRLFWLSRPKKEAKKCGFAL
ncbi:MAG: hypothetical protein JEY79_16860 [Pseudodesulfovibrio sp.]|nr:hypothetical protein [Pseudodesulfovibrio sp.]